MQIKLTCLTTLILSATLVACGGSDSPAPAVAPIGTGSTGNGDTGGGDTTGGDSGGDTTGGDTGGDTTGGGGTGTVGGTLTGSAQFLGFISVDEDITSNKVEVGASFLSSANSVLASVLEAGLASELTPELDQCTVDAIDTPNPTGGLPPSFPGFNVVSAGEVIPFTSAAGSYVQLMRNQQSGFTFYSSDPETVTGSIPARLTANVPGEVFPAVGNVSVPAVDSLVVMAPANGIPVTPSTSFSWTPGSNPDGFIEISMTQFSVAGLTVVDCVVRDDGEFAFSAATQAEMGTDFVSLFTDIERVAVSIQQQGAAVLVVTATSAR